jgi:hypothetical protein
VNTGVGTDNDNVNKGLVEDYELMILLASAPES